MNLGAGQAGGIVVAEEAEVVLQGVWGSVAAQCKRKDFTPWLIHPKVVRKRTV